MSRPIHRTIVCVLSLLLASVAVAGEAINLRLSDGSRWRGNIDDVVAVEYRQSGATLRIEGALIKKSDMYVIVEGKVAGSVRQKTIFLSDIVSLKTVRAGASAAGTAATTGSGTAAGPSSASPDGSATPAKAGQGVFLLPLEGPVGENIRHDEIEEIGEHADTFGDNQIIVLRISTDGGSAFESQLIAETIFDLRQRHRVIAWIEKAISAGCQLALCCNEIYFMTEGTAGSVTTWDGQGTSIKGEELRRSMEELARIAERGGRSRYIAYSMKTNDAECSYDKDPVTGKVTFYGDQSGQHLLSDDKSNLCFNSSNAEHSGFSDGTADTYEELAALLDLAEWREVDEYGRKISADWNKTVAKAHREVPRLLAELDYKNRGSGDQIAILGTRINIMQQLIKWCDRCPPVAQFDKEALRRQVAQMKKELADLRRADRNR